MVGPGAQAFQDRLDPGPRGLNLVAANDMADGAKKIVREAMSMYGVPVMPMLADPTDPPGGFAVAKGPMVVGPVSQRIAPVVASSL